MFLLKRGQSSIQSLDCIFFGHEKGEKDYKLWDPYANKVMISRDVVFDEKSTLRSTQAKKIEAQKTSVVISKLWRWVFMPSEMVHALSELETYSS